MRRSTPDGPRPDPGSWRGGYDHVLAPLRPAGAIRRRAVSGGQERAVTMPGPRTTTELRPVPPPRGGHRRLARGRALLALAPAGAAVKPRGTAPPPAPSTHVQDVS